ncbi:hypothetical protein [Brevibacillus fulvus]|uniref:Uncharacterized protein n=1 Tax=Brevibacillus fulvus TaxID=1125967 RepID=A0A938XV04_9BACL|nr:hypothetical protein [Brevibacillus fulvus]MBM7590602.1 hypothetical protein [Brevibacillus fulvus]
MVRKIAFQLIFGMIAFIATFISALGANVFSVAFLRAFIAFIIFFLVAFPVRWLLSLITSTKPADAPQAKSGNHVDLVTPEDEPESAESSQKDSVDSFVPLTVPKIERTATATDPATIANAVRRLTDE